MSGSHGGNVLYINEKQITLPYPIKDSISIREMTVVRIDSNETLPLGDKSLNRNVLAFDNHANLIWTIQEAPHGGHDRSKPYTNIHLLDRLPTRTFSNQKSIPAKP